MSAPRPRPFELVPRRRFIGASFGRRRSARRGQGDEVAGTRPYRPGDQRAHIHWPASARLSSARGSDEFIVREFYADEAPAVALVVDRRPAMSINDPPSPWLDKRAAADAAVGLIAASAAAERADLLGVDQPGQSLQLGLERLARRSPELPPGSFVFVVSDFLVPVPTARWLRLRALGWDVVPVVVQDPTWEQSFPAVGGIVLPIRDPETGESADLWIGPREAGERAWANEQRLASLQSGFSRLGFDPVLVATSDPWTVAGAFDRWADRRRQLRRLTRV